LQPHDFFETGIVTANLGIKVTYDNTDVSFREDLNNGLQSGAKLLFGIFIAVVGWGITMYDVHVDPLLFCYERGCDDT
jgi:hypothetical protein